MAAPDPAGKHAAEAGTRFSELRGGVEIKKAIADLCHYALSNISNEARRVEYAQIDEGQAERIKRDAGIEVSGYRRILDNFSIRHMLDEHGDEEKEKARGQLAVTEGDIISIPTITDNPDYVVSGGKTHQGLESIWNIKKINGYVYFLEEARTKHGQLAAVTMFKSQEGTTAKDAPSEVLKRLKSPPSQTSETLRGNHKIVAIPELKIKKIEFAKTEDVGEKIGGARKGMSRDRFNSTKKTK